LDAAIFLDPTAPAPARAADLVRRLTRAEKVAQTMIDAPAIPRLGVPAYFWWNESLHGLMRGRATVFPQSIGLAATFDADLIHRVATTISDEARAQFNEAESLSGPDKFHGLSFFAPNVNIFRDPRWGRGQETFGEDPFLTAQLGVAFIDGMQGDDPHYLKTVATAKHFAVHSGPEAERHRFDARVSAHDLADTYLPQFEACVRDGHVASVMASYNRVDGEAAVASPTLLRDTLRGRWGFEGYVVGDCGAVDDVFTGHHLVSSLEAAAVAALRAGTDLDCGRAFASLGSAVQRGLVSDRELDRALIRLFTARVRMGLFDPPALVPWTGLTAAVLESPAHLALAREAAARSVVLLKNDGPVLPLSPVVRHLAVVGPTAYDIRAVLGNYHGTPSRMVTLVDGLEDAAKARGVAVSYARGAPLVGPQVSAAELADAVQTTEASDVVVAVLGLDPLVETEEGESKLNPKGDRRELGLPAGQEALLEAMTATGKPVIVVLTGGSALAVPWAAAHASAIAYVWYPGVEGAAALADVLFGKTNPAGRLPITVYRSAADLPPFRDYGMQGRTYRYFEGAPLYPFGFGLSYTKFRYSALTVSPKEISVEVENVGGVAGDEVVEVYVLPKAGASYAPRRWLAAFARTTLAVGERRSVRLALSPQALSSVDERGDRRPLTGDVEIAVGGSQPDRVGHYSDSTLGITGILHLDTTHGRPLAAP
jgi:beta-glucosidase